MRRCEHDLVYSGQTNTSFKFQHICRKCGQCGWSNDYVMAQVNFYEFCQLRAMHGWPVPPNGATLLYLDTAPKPKPKPVAVLWFNSWIFGGVSNTYALLMLAIWCAWTRRFSVAEVALLAVVFPLAAFSWYRVLRG